jgi:hypothetical protein
MAPEALLQRCTVPAAAQWISYLENNLKGKATSILTSSDMVDARLISALIALACLTALCREKDVISIRTNAQNPP